MFDKRAELELHLDRPSYLPGQELRVVVRTTAERDAEVLESRLELVWRNKYQYSETRTDSDGDSHTTTTTDEERYSIGSQPFHPPGDLEKGSVHEVQLAFPVPSEFPASGTGTVTEVEWFLEAELKLKRALDPTASSVVPVLSPVPPSWDEPDAMAQPAGDLVSVAIDVDDPRAVAGGEITGTLHLVPIASRRVKVHLHLIRLEEVTVPRGLSAEEEIVGGVLAADVELVAGEPMALPFRLQVPTGACPTLHTN